MNASATVLITPLSYPGAELLLPLGADVPKVTGGVGKWNEIDRPRRRAMSEYAGESLLKLTFSVMLDAWPNGNVEDLIRRIYGWGARNNLPYQPTILRLAGPLPYVDLPYVLVDPIEETERAERRSDGIRCRQELRLNLLEYQAPDILVQAPTPAVAAQQRQDSNPPSSNQPAEAKPKTYKVVRGDTLSSIAAKQLGSANKWKTLADLNSIRDPRKLQAGQTIRLS
jgi:LysM repeat protein